MNIYRYKTSSNRNIVVFKNVYDYSHRMNLMKWMLKSQFTFGHSHDSTISSFKSNLILSAHPTVSPDELWKMFKFNDENTEPLQKEIGKERFLQRCWVNVDFSKNSNYYHSDEFKEGSVSMLYYANMEWHNSWDGHTIWSSDTLEQIEHIEPYEPGKIVIFDSKIPHKPCASSPESPSYRFTFNSIWAPS